MKAASVRVSFAIFFCAALGCALYVLSSGKSSPDSNVGASELFSKLFSWSNDADDGVSVLHGEQHGLTRIISACDPDDPACTYHVAPNQNYQESFWTGPAEVGNDKVSVQVQKQHLLPSSIEDDLREGPDSRLGKTDGGGSFFRHPYSLATFDTIPIHARQGEVDLGDLHPTGAVRVESRAGSSGTDRLFGPGPDPAARYEARDPGSWPLQQVGLQHLQPVVTDEVPAPAARRLDDDSHWTPARPGDQFAGPAVRIQPAERAEAGAAAAAAAEARPEGEAGSSAEVMDRLEALNRNLQEEVRANLAVKARLDEIRRLSAQLQAQEQEQQGRIRSYIAEEQGILDSSAAAPADSPAAASAASEDAADSATDAVADAVVAAAEPAAGEGEAPAGGGDDAAADGEAPAEGGDGAQTEAVAAAEVGRAFKNLNRARRPVVRRPEARRG